ncbi:hypothetical protein [Paenibacillus puerhi]|uniref:hypothetical protein n=1 Tax=Paenibacillus puerhi TaxID=2692622 RepID=UPI0013597666|nr:hypothetical protein [Paenibacillus puerhi]
MNGIGIRLLNTLGLVLVLVVNWLANALPLNGLSTKELSDMFPVQITPAPYAFAIWGLIYALLAVYIIVQWLPTHQDDREVVGANPWFLLSCLLNTGWLLLWHYLYTISSVFAMLGLLAALIGAYVGTRPSGWSSEPLVRYFVQLPFSIYLGWISVATIVNVIIGLDVAGWDGFGWSETAWTVILLIVALLLGITIGWRFRDPAYPLTVAWGIAAVGVTNLGSTPVIVYTAWGAAALLVLSAIWILTGAGNVRKAVNR